MLKKEITYEDYNGEKQTDVYYFNLSKAELVDMSFGDGKSVADTIRQATETQDRGRLIGLFKQLVLDSYGEKSEDGKRFIKSQELREQFAQTAAYSELFMELATNDQAAIKFTKGLLPKDLADGLNQQRDQDKSVIPPTSLR